MNKKTTKKTNNTIKEVIKHFGGGRKTAEILGVTPGYVSHLKNSRRKLTGSLAVLIAKKTNNKFTETKLLRGE